MTRGHRMIRLRARLSKKVETKDWYFAFFDSNDRELPWYLSDVLKPGYKHVLAFSSTNNDVLVIDPIARFVDIQLRSNPMGRNYSCPPDFIAADFFLNGATKVLKIRWNADHAFTSHDISNCYPGCVTLMKSLLGVAVWVFTPWQFYNWLLDNGAEEYTHEIVSGIVLQVQEDRAHGRW